MMETRGLLKWTQTYATGGTAPPTDTELLRSLRASWEERGKLLDRLLVARMLDLAMVASLIDRSPDPDALSELRAIILEAVELIKGLRREMEVKNEKK